MGECGCISIPYDNKIELADGRTLFVGIYPSCHYCDTPAGVQFFAAEGEDADWINEVHKPKPLINDNGYGAIMVINQQSVEKMIVELFDGQDGMDRELVKVIAEEFELRQVVFDSIAQEE